MVTGVLGAPPVDISPCQIRSPTWCGLSSSGTQLYSPSPTANPLVIERKARARSVIRQTSSSTASTLTVSMASPSASRRGRMTPSPAKPTKAGRSPKSSSTSSSTSNSPWRADGRPARSVRLCRRRTRVRRHTGRGRHREGDRPLRRHRDIRRVIGLRVERVGEGETDFRTVARNIDRIAQERELARSLRFRPWSVRRARLESRATRFGRLVGRAGTRDYPQRQQGREDMPVPSRHGRHSYPFWWRA